MVTVVKSSNSQFISPLHDQDDFSDLDELQFLQQAGVDIDGRPIIQIIGKYLPIKVIGHERLRDYINLRMHQVNESAKEEEDEAAAEARGGGGGEGEEGEGEREGQFEDGKIVLLYIHTGVIATENSPGIRFLCSLYENFPISLKQRIQNIFILHPAIGLRMMLWVLSYWFTDGFYSKVTFISRVEFLTEFIQKDEIDIPDFVMEHDKELESRPLMDYGIDVDPLQGNIEASSGRYAERYGSVS